MFFHKRESKLLITLKYGFFWVGLLLIMLTFFNLTRKSDLRIPQKEVVLTIDVKDKINICLPSESIESGDSQ